MGTKLHEDELDKYIERLNAEGYRCIKLNGKSPDAVAVRIQDGSIEISAVEALGSSHQKGKGWTKGWTWANKKRIYSMFDKVLIHVFRRDSNLSKSLYCNYKRCAKTVILPTKIMDNELFFCEHHMDIFMNETLDSKTAFVYWCMDNLKKSIFRILNK